MNTDSPEIVITEGDGVTVATPTKIFIGTCERCKLPSRVEIPDEDRSYTFMTCLHCDDDVPSVHAERLYATVSEGSCDARCMGAVGKDCSCACGGANHAGAYRFSRYKSEATESAIQKLIKSREKRERAAAKRRERAAEKAAEPFNEWLSSLDTADAALISWMRSYENVENAPTGILVDFRLRMMATPGNEAKKPARPLTENQMDLAWKIVQRMANECERENDQKENGTPVPEGRFRVHGKVISRRADSEPGMYGREVTKYKILVQCDGYRVWGNCPRDLVSAVWPAVEDGFMARANESELPADLYVAFNATVKRSDRDDYFGFFRNPRSAERSVADPKIPGLDITVSDAKRIAAHVSKPQSADQPAPSVETSAPVQDAPETSSAPRKTGSHADCTHEATKSARAKCRRERMSK